MHDVPEFTRQRALDAYRIIDTLPERAYDDIVRVAAAVCGVPIALLSLIDRDRQWFKAQLGLDLRQTARDEAVCNHAIRQPERLLEVPDLAHDPRFADFPAVVGDEGVRFYAGMPLVTPGGAAIGTLCVIDRQPHQLDDTQRDALEALARLTVNLLEGRQRERVLERADLLGRARRDGAPFTVAVIELQDYAGLVARVGERHAEKLLARLDAALEAVLRAGDRLDRVTHSPEYVAVLHGEDAAQALHDLEAAAHALEHDAPLRILVGSAAATAADEPVDRVYLRADEALSRAKGGAAAA